MIDDEGGREEYSTLEEVLEWARRRLREVEEEERMLRALIALLEERETLRPDETLEEIRVGRKRVGRLHTGSNYVRAVPETPIVLLPEIREYLVNLEEELRSTTLSNLEPPRLVIREKPDGTLHEVRFDNLQTTVEFIKAKAGLRYAIETSAQIARNRGREREIEVR